MPSINGEDVVEKEVFWGADEVWVINVGSLDLDGLYVYNRLNFDDGRVDAADCRHVDIRGVAARAWVYWRREGEAYDCSGETI